MKGFLNILTGSGNKGTIQTSEFTDDVVALPSFKVRARIIDDLDRSNRPTEHDKGKYHEEGGMFGLDKDGNEVSVDAKPGMPGDPKHDNEVSVDVANSARQT